MLKTAAFPAGKRDSTAKKRTFSGPQTFLAEKIDALAAIIKTLAAKNQIIAAKVRYIYSK